MPGVLMVAEKPSICTAIAQALSRNSMNSRGKTPPVHEFEGIFMGKPAFIRVTSVTGHVFSMDFPKAYQNWEAVQPAELFDAPVISVADSKGGIVKHLEREAKGMDYLVLWLDCDREGENICFEVIRCVEASMNKARSDSKQIIYRAKFSAVTPKDIEKAMQNLVSPNENESKAVEARQELDLKVGVAFSRFQTQYFQGKYGDLDSSVISYGPCQTPTLGFCVERYDEIQSFTSESFWNIDVTVEVGQSGKQQNLLLEWIRGRLFDQSAAEIFIRLITVDTHVVCESVKTSETRRLRPQPMNTVEMLKIASSKLGIGPHATMKAAEELYLCGYLSYPRTESTQYSSSFDIRETLLQFKRSDAYGSYVSKLLRDGHIQPRSGVDMGDHPPITPVAFATGLSGDKGRLYDLIVCHFLATVSEDALYLSTKVTCRAPTSGEAFTISGRKEINSGFLGIYGSDSSDRCIELPDCLEEGQKYRILDVKLRQGKTTAPDYLTESELIGLMEKNGIGTDASIATHINNVIVRNYVSLGSGRTLVPTALGIVLVHGYLRIDPALVLPEVRAAIENFCNLIAKGHASKEQVVDHSLRNFAAKFQYFTLNIAHMDALFESRFSPLASTGKFLSKCGKCARYMRYIPLKPQRLYCPTCEETYSLPQNGTIKLYKEYKCPLDKFELVFFSLGNAATAQGKSYPLCPYCYNHPPKFASSHEANDNTVDCLQSSSPTGEFKLAAAAKGVGQDTIAGSNNDDSDGGSEDSDEDNHLMRQMGCDSCRHPSCKHSLTVNGICECPGANASGAKCRGTLVLDVNSKPNWKLSCNRCNTLLRFNADIHEITPLPRQECESCGLRITTFEFSKVKSPLPNGETVYTGCIACSDFLNRLTEIVLGRSVNLTVLRQMRHKRGGGRAGRSRGRGKPRGDPKMSFSEW